MENVEVYQQGASEKKLLVTAWQKTKIIIR